MLGHTFALDNNDENEKTLGEKVKIKFKEVFGDSFNVSLSYFDKPEGMRPYVHMNYAHMLLEKNIDDFEAEHGVRPKYVAISDTDSVYMTPVAPEDMFDERGRPVIISRLLSSKKRSY